MLLNEPPFVAVPIIPPIIPYYSYSPSNNLRQNTSTGLILFIVFLVEQVFQSKSQCSRIPQ
jgi:hypothetical protein